ncbi:MULTISPECIES: hypothetical protein [Leptolyngbya]|jgi:hypothetical protein|uniref:Uncharacterized protein n=1 Tax=Leptolyngbya boryana NIES-2135 TaxID=1973484 RepID=A0A1Z4J9J0_LEPBY|nr:MULTISPECIES: hypothetical protein [Leptolyngbya]BAY53410.1 hypothetical protein NIES2135_02150 [Leptolyngbya boryana NIES-2135]MBD1855586.1 hypothetical protein [Leptolyngbya sp. FACHB-1624]MBD2366726.1 hypothetical protein [Leptolyngbya sp. FACHB-161]MBD2373260.1 hypothetical protein [Leptolyngbya sp. FACHB-238]MBD2397660.1 hypothetical protein [Leptolyngbya sp. FACHB-239]
MKSNASNGQFSNTAVCEPQTGASNPSLEKLKLLYGADQQEKLQDLQAEADSLLKQLQALKQQRTDQAVVTIS